MTWNPEKYLKFKNERSQPFIDIRKLIKVRPDLKVLDLGCGTGNLTVELSKLLLDSEVLGIDNSKEMLEKAPTCKGVRYEMKAIKNISGSWDLIFSNSALHWIDDHYSLLSKLFSMLNPGGQLALQFPSSHRNKAHTSIIEVADKTPFKESMGGWKWNFPVLDADEYAEIIFNAGGEEITIFDKVYPHILQNADEVLEWVTSTTLTIYFKKLPTELHEQFKLKCREKFWEMWPSGPLLFPFRRVIISAIKPK